MKKDLRAKKGQESWKKRWNEDQPTDKVEEDSNEEEDWENSEKPASSRQMKRKINIMGPISLAADRRGLRVRDRTVLAVETVKAASIVVQNTNISTTTPRSPGLQSVRSYVRSSAVQIKSLFIGSPKCWRLLGPT